MKIKNKYIFKILNSKKGGLSIPMIPMILAFVAAVIMCVEYFIMVSSLNDIQLIMDNVANSALRTGVKHELHKDENIIELDDTTNTIKMDSIDIKKIRETYSDLLWENLDKSIARYSLQGNGTTMKDNFTLRKPSGASYVDDSTFLTNPANSQSPTIILEKTNWSNTHSTNNQDVDTVILDAVVKVRLKTSKMIPKRVIEYTFKRKEHNGTSGVKTTEFNSEVVNDDTTSGFTTLIVRSSTRMILK